MIAEMRREAWLWVPIIQVMVAFVLVVFNVFLIGYYIYTAPFLPISSPHRSRPEVGAYYAEDRNWHWHKAAKVTTSTPPPKPVAPYLRHLPANEDICTTIDPLTCTVKNLRLVVVIPSAPSRKDARVAIRHTWGHYAAQRDVVLFFIIGKAANKKLQQQIENERKLYNDILQLKLIDSQANSTLKAIALLKWVGDYCSQADYLLKTEDNVFVNIPRLFTYMSKRDPRKNAMYGRVHKNWKTVRNKKSYYYLPKSEYKPSKLPRFIFGGTYLMPARLAKYIYYYSLKRRLIRLPDLFITGIMAQRLHIERLNNRLFHFSPKDITSCTVQDSISIREVTETKQFIFWKESFYGDKRCKKL
ncbi:hypothetical protein PPYR_05405 [Photinus pyralis]|uniref:Hexosyltransferase n=1 Tax=Photinus pyralis TaxID=7054 RepID=A0A5N4AUN0_PHOPY|nr:beta-1,3-galactosyltransferase 1-like [Photinus pyralis]KAB0801051.1 hypothetical protein PPYR_05405 [Photinus pyralis]